MAVEVEEWREIPTNYTRGYAVTRGWADWEIVREFVQNALDATGTASVEKIGDELLVTDRGRGFNAVNLLMGTTTKSPCERGRFGEGMKIACLAALNLGYVVEIETDAMLVRPEWKVLEIEEPATKEIVKAEIMVFKYKGIPQVGGTRIHVKKYPRATYDEKFNFEANKKVVFKKEFSKCEDKLYPNYIIDEPEKQIYVRNIYVKEIEKAIYSYDIFNVTLSTDRNIPDMDNVYTQVGILWSYVSDLSMLAEFFKSVKAEGFESECRLSSSTMEEGGTKHAWKEAFYKFFGANAIISTDEEATKLAEYHTKFLKKGISLPGKIYRALHYIGVPTDQDVLEEIEKKPPSYLVKLEETQEANVEYLKMIHYKLKEKYFPQLTKVFIATRESMLDSVGKVFQGNIIIREDKTGNMVDLLDNYGHEGTHIIFPELMDNTSAFYAKIGQVMATITKVVVEEAPKPPKGVKW